MSVGDALVGIGATALDAALSPKSWLLRNLDTNEEIQGQFPAEEATNSVGANWSPITAMSRQSPILQFINGVVETLTVPSRFYKTHILATPATDRIAKLKSWCAVDPLLGRPPILNFSLGDGQGLNLDVVLVGVEATFRRPTPLNGILEVPFTMSFIAWKKFDIDAPQVTDTRYAHAKSGETYEYLAFVEYGEPMLGVVLRQRHATRPLLREGDVVKLPAPEGIRDTRIEAQSIPLKTSFGRKLTPQKVLLQEYLSGSRGAPKVSFVL